MSNNLVGTYECVCPAGYEVDMNTKDCVDVDKCNELTCDGNRKCINTDGSFECVCAEGYREGGINCIDIDECLDGDACDENLLEAHRQELKLQPQMKLVLIRQLQLRVPALQLRALQPAPPRRPD